MSDQSRVESAADEVDRIAGSSGDRVERQMSRRLAAAIGEHPRGRAVLASLALRRMGRGYWLRKHSPVARTVGWPAASFASLALAASLSLTMCASVNPSAPSREPALAEGTQEGRWHELAARIEAGYAARRDAGVNHGALAAAIMKGAPAPQRLHPLRLREAMERAVYLVASFGERPVAASWLLRWVDAPDAHVRRSAATYFCAMTPGWRAALGPDGARRIDEALAADPRTGEKR